MNTVPLITVPHSLHPKLRDLFTQIHNTLPPFRQSAIRLIDLVSKDTTSTQQLSRIIMNDPGLSSRVLRLANSLAYSPTTSITSVHHAVVWLGLDNLRTIVGTIQLLDELLPSLHHSPHLMRLITSAILAAVQSSELGTAIEHPDVPSLYTRTLLYNIVDMMICYQAPDLYEALQSIQRSQRHLSHADELSVLGVTRRQYGVLLSALWRIPEDYLTHAHEGMDPIKSLPATPWTTYPAQRAGLVLATNLLALEQTGNQNPKRIAAFQELLQVGCQLPPGRTERLLTEAVDKGHQIIRSAGISDIQDPVDIPEAISEDTHRDQVAKFQEESARSTDLNALLNSFMKALQATLRFKRIALTLLDPHDTSRLIGRYLIGAEPQSHLPALTGSLHADHPFFLTILKRTDPIIVPAMDKHISRDLSPYFLQVWKPNACLIGPIRINNRPIGLLYADFGPQTPSMSPRLLAEYQLFYVPLSEGLSRLTKR